MNLAARGKTALKAAVSGSLLLLIILRADMDAMRNLLQRSDLRLIPVIILLFFTSLLVRTMRWKILLESQERREFSLGTLYLVSLQGIPYGYLLPTGIGGDLVRYFSLRRYCRVDGASIAVSLLSDGLIGAASAFFLILISVPFASVLPFRTIVLIVIASLSLLMTLTVMLSGRFLRLRRFHIPAFGQPASGRLDGKLGRLYHRIGQLTGNRSIPGAAFPVSIGFLLLHGLQQYVILLCIGTSVPFLFLLFSILVSKLLLLLPISFGGIGVREASLAALLALVGVSTGEVVVLSFYGYALVVLTFLTVSAQPLVSRWLPFNRSAAPRSDRSPRP